MFSGWYNKEWVMCSFGSAIELENLKADGK